MKILGIQILFKTLQKQNDLDPSRFSIMGASFGSPFAILAAASEPGFHGLVVMYGFGNIQKTIAHRIEKAWAPKWGILSIPLSWVISQSLSHY